MKEAQLNETTELAVPTVLMEADGVADYDPVEADSEADDGTELYILDIRHTPLATQFLAEGAAGIKPERVTAFLEARGFATAAKRGVTIRGDGKVLVFSETDPTNDWQSFTNTPTPEEAADAGPVLKLRAFQKKSNAGTATAKDVSEIVPIIVGAMLKAYGHE